MPLPKLSKSKTVSRRIKKPKPLLFAASQAELLTPGKPSKPPRERRVRVICTDPDATDSSSDEEGEQAPFSPRYTHKRLVREICLPASPPISVYESRQEETSIGSVSASNRCLASEKREGFKIARKDVGMQSLYEMTEESIVGPLADGHSGCPGAEEFAQFLDDFLGVHEEISIRTWDEELALLDDSIFDIPLNLELDFEPTTWIHTVQTTV